MERPLPVSRLSAVYNGYETWIYHFVCTSTAAVILLPSWHLETEPARLGCAASLGPAIWEMDLKPDEHKSFDWRSRALLTLVLPMPRTYLSTPRPSLSPKAGGNTIPRDGSER